jgi:hypothetical protein
VTDPSFLVLASLAEGAKHGYAMMDNIRTFAGVRLGPVRSTAPLRASNSAAGFAPYPPPTAASHTKSPRRASAISKNSSRASTL